MSSSQTHFVEHTWQKSLKRIHRLDCMSLVGMQTQLCSCLGVNVSAIQYGSSCKTSAAPDHHCRFALCAESVVLGRTAKHRFVQPRSRALRTSELGKCTESSALFDFIRLDACGCVKTIRFRRRPLPCLPATAVSRIDADANKQTLDVRTHHQRAYENHTNPSGSPSQEYWSPASGD